MHRGPGVAICAVLRFLHGLLHVRGIDQSALRRVDPDEPVELFVPAGDVRKVVEAEHQQHVAGQRRQQVLRIDEAELRVEVADRAAAPWPRHRRRQERHAAELGHRAMRCFAAREDEVVGRDRGRAAHDSLAPSLLEDVQVVRSHDAGAHFAADGRIAQGSCELVEVDLAMEPPVGPADERRQRGRVPVVARHVSSFIPSAAAALPRTPPRTAPPACTR